MKKEEKISYEEALAKGLTRVCSKCGKEKSVSEFYKHKGCKYGVRSVCKECDKEYKKEYGENNKEYYKEYYENNKDKIKEQNKEYRENNKEYYKEYYENNKEHYKEYRENNKDKIKEYHKEYRENNKDKIKEQQKEYYENNKDKIKEQKKEYKKEYHQTPRGREVARRNKQKRKALTRASQWCDFTLTEQVELWERNSKQCFYSEETIEDFKNVHYDHIYPLSKGGATAPWNLIPVKNVYNLQKKDTDTLDWYRQQPYFSEERLEFIINYVIEQAKKYIENVPYDDPTLRYFGIDYYTLCEEVGFVPEFEEEGQELDYFEVINSVEEMEELWGKHLDDEE